MIGGRNGARWLAEQRWAARAAFCAREMYAQGWPAAEVIDQQWRASRSAYEQREYWNDEYGHEGNDQ